MSWRSTGPCAHALAAAAFAAMLAFSTAPGTAQRMALSGPFAGLPGSWLGGGAVTLASGVRERIRCRATYAALGSDSVQLDLRCASDSYKFELKSSVNHRAGGISGTWVETLRNAAGHLVGRASGGHIQVRIDSPAFSAQLAVTTRGDRQSVTIRSPGSELSEVSITLTRQSG
jgi:hypothetical protein